MRENKRRPGAESQETLRAGSVGLQRQQGLACTDD